MHHFIGTFFLYLQVTSYDPNHNELPCFTVPCTTEFDIHFTIVIIIIKSARYQQYWNKMGSSDCWVRRI